MITFTILSLSSAPQENRYWNSNFNDTLYSAMQCCLVTVIYHCFMLDWCYRALDGDCLLFSLQFVAYARLEVFAVKNCSAGFQREKCF
jgi:hypothetical protein